MIQICDWGCSLKVKGKIFAFKIYYYLEHNLIRSKNFQRSSFNKVGIYV